MLIVPSSMKKAKAKRHRKEEQKKFLEDYSKKVGFDVETFFKNKEFINAGVSELRTQFPEL